ncbi:MAG: exopolysaccharide biosynthesis polyprenyl glycosylphosphotransferase [Pseudomonadota bacterium]
MQSEARKGMQKTFRRLEAETPSLSEAAQTVSASLTRGTLEPLWLTCVLICIDLPVFAVATWFAQYVSVPTAAFNPVVAASLATVASAVFVASMVVTGGYRSGAVANLWSSLTRSSLCSLLPGIGLVALTPTASPAAAGLAIVTCLAAAVLPARYGVRVAVSWAIETGLIARRALIAGGGEAAAQLIRGLATQGNSDIRLVGIFDDRDEARSPIQVLGVPKLGGYDELMAFVRASEIQMVIIALPLSAEKRINWLLNEFRVLPVEVRLSAYSQDYSFAHSDLGRTQAGFRRSFGPDRQLAKRVFDLVFATIALALLWPIMGLAALAIRLESQGPVLFRQRRHGYNHREIDVLKFRSMYHHMADPGAVKNVTRDDPRVTRVGRFLRRSSIDELPQLLNVLRGELSLVGPRPHALNAKSSQHERYSQIVDGYSARHRLPPGITGWAQINGWRGEIDEAEKLKARFEHDLFYIENWSLWFDLKILFRTPFALFRSTGAY